MKANNTAHLSDSWPSPRDFRRSVRLEFAVYATGLFLVLMLAATYFTTRQAVDLATRSVAETLVVQARAFSGPAGKHILAADEPDVLLLNDICIKLAEDNPDVYWAGIAGTDSAFLAHTDFKAVISGELLVLQVGSQDVDYLRKGETFVVQSDTVYVSAPIEVNDVTIGRLGLAASSRQIQAAQRKALVASISISLALIVIGVPFVVLILQRKLRPVSVITQSLQQVDLNDLKLDIPIRTKNEFGYLAATLHTMGEKLSEAQSMAVERERVARELEIARDIQMSILPRSFPSGRNFQFAGSYTSALKVGGDYYDFIPIDEHHLGIVVADVSGKSLPGMLVMLMTRDIVRSVAQSESDPGMLLNRVNRELLGNIHKDMFVTMFFGVLEVVTGKVRFASAGHNALVWYRAGLSTCELIRPPGYPLGMMPAPVFEQRIKTAELRLGEGDWLCQYTDGVNEAQNSELEEFGMERLTEAIKHNSQEGAQSMVSRFMAQHAAFVGDADQYDDITLLALKWSLQTAETMNTGKEQRVRVAEG